jgi:hypothetical protein
MLGERIVWEVAFPLERSPSLLTVSMLTAFGLIEERGQEFEPSGEFQPLPSWWVWWGGPPREKTIRRFSGRRHSYAKRGKMSILFYLCRKRT